MSLQKLFYPQSVAVIGASREEGTVGNSIVKNLINNFKGKIFLINPKATEIMGVSCCKSITEVSDTIDLAILVVPAKITGTVLNQCGEKNIKAVIIISAGFKEVGVEGAKLEKEIIEICNCYEIKMVGPNCLGIINPYNNLNASFATTIPAKGKIAFMSQSGALCTAILDWAKQKNIGFSRFVSIGNKAVLDECDFLEEWKDDNECAVILAYLEGIKRGRKFLQIAREVTKKKPVVILKSGKTASGSKAASSHTGTLSGSDKAYTSVFKQTNVIRANTLEELFDMGVGFACFSVPQVSGIAIVTNAGGPGILSSDAVEESGMRLCTIDSNIVAKLREFLPAAANFYNPIDVLGDADPERYFKALKIILQDSAVGTILALATPQAMTKPVLLAEKICEIVKETAKPIFPVFMGGEEMQPAEKVFMQNNIYNFSFPEDAVNTTAKMFFYNANNLYLKDFQAPQLSVDKNKVKELLNKVSQEGRVNLGDFEAREVLQSYGFKLPQSKLAKNSGEAVEFAEEIGYPVVMKIVSPEILHKTDIGGVKVNLKNAQEVEKAFQLIKVNTRKFFPDADIWGMQIQQMLKSGIEVILGMSKDPQFGPLIMFGLGGIYVEVLKDVSFRVAPLSEQDIEAMFCEVKSFPLLRGARGSKPADISAIKESLFKLSQLVMDFPEIVELDINPLIVYNEKEGAVALDSRITIEEKKF